MSWTATVEDRLRERLIDETSPKQRREMLDVEDDDELDRLEAGERWSE